MKATPTPRVLLGLRIAGLLAVFGTALPIVLAGGLEPARREVGLIAAAVFAIAFLGSTRVRLPDLLRWLFLAVEGLAGVAVVVAFPALPAPVLCVVLAAEHTDSIDVLLTDLIMPKLGEAELADAVRELHPEVRVIYGSSRKFPRPPREAFRLLARSDESATP